jgi:hypothetical protein
MASPFSFYKASKLGLKALIIAGLIIVIVILLRQGKASSFQSAPLVVQPTSEAATSAQSLFDIKPSLDCTPGPSENAAYYTSGLTPGGLCGDGEFIRGQIRDYSIADGIGGSLLEK